MASPYEVAIHLTVTGNAQAGLAGLSQQMNTLNQGAQNLHKTFALIFAGGMMKRWGEETLGGIKKVIDAAGELSHELTQIRKLGITPQQFDQARAAAVAVSKQVPGVTTADALKIYGSSYSMFGDETLKMMSSIATFSQVLGAQSGNYDKAADNVLAMIRAGDLMGKFVDSTTHQVDVGKLQHFLDLGTKVITATHGVVNPQTWFMLAQQGGPALSGMTDEGLMTMAIAAQAMKGPRAGTALFSMYQQMVGGTMAQYKAKNLQELGLVGDFKAGQGGNLQWAPGALDTPFAGALKSDPLKAVQILQDALTAHGKTTIDQQVPELFKLLGRQTTIRLAHDLLRNMPQIMGERGRIAGGLGISASGALQNEQDFEQVTHNFATAFHDMIAKIGLPATIAAIPVMNKIRDVFLSIGVIASEHPEAAKNLLALAAGFGVAMTALGALAISVGLAGLLGGGVIIVGITALTGALVGLAAANWPTISSGIQGLIDNLNGLRNAIVGIEVAAFDKVVGWIHSFGDAISGLWEKLKSLNPFSHTSYEGGGEFGGGGGGVTKAAWSGGAGSAGRALSSGERGAYASMIRQYGGAQAENLLKIYGTEGASSYVGDHGSSFGPFQLHMQGLAGGANSGSGMGDLFKRQTGLDPRDKSTVRAQIEWMKRYGETHGGYSSDIWHGLRGHGGSLRTAPQGMPPKGSQGSEQHVHNIYLNDTKIATAVSKQLARHGQYTTSIGRQDGRGVFMGPGAEAFA